MIFDLKLLGLNPFEDIFLEHLPLCHLESNFLLYGVVERQQGVWEHRQDQPIHPDLIPDVFIPVGLEVVILLEVG